MATVLEVRQQIRFELDQLRVRNAHHEFEHLCRDLARLRICSNILPATGPVSAGGDQGRDFETYRTYLHSTSLADSTFMSLVSERPLVFACTTQSKGISAKIKADVGIIVKGNFAVEGIYCFCTENVPVAERHALREWAKKVHGTQLEILDGQAISESLSDRELFWIAERHLHIPAEVYPRLPLDQESGWYEKLLIAWKNRAPRLQNYSDFAEIKSAIRRATFAAEIKQDIPFWIALLEQYRTEASPVHLQRRATYEIAVASLRGLGKLSGQEGRIRDYFGPVVSLNATDDLMDASCLLDYSTGAHDRGEVDLSAEEINDWRTAFVAHLEELLRTETSAGVKAHLAMLLGSQELTSAFQLNEDPKLDTTMNWWLKVPRFARNAPLFPVWRFSDYLTAAVPLIGMHPKYEKLVQATDRLLAKRAGGAAAGEKCRDRALAFHEQGKSLRAIDELHKAKIDWFSDESLGGSILAMLLIADWYCELGLAFAGKYYAMAAAWAAIGSSNNEDRQHAASALRAAALCDYQQGSWFGTQDMVAAFVATDRLFSARSVLQFEKEELEQFARDLATMVVLGKRIAPEQVGLLDAFADFIKMAEWGKELVPVLCNHWNGVSLDEVWKQMQKELAGRPFGDSGATREVVWPELGITWRVKWKNDYLHTILGEQFVAVLQILLADLAEVELCLLQTGVTVTLEAGDVDSPKLEYLPSNERVAWRVVLPSSGYDGPTGVGFVMRNALATAGGILSSVSLLHEGQLHHVLERAFRGGVSTKVFVVRSYAEIYRAFVEKDRFEAAQRHLQDVPLADREFEASAHKDLEWRDGPGPGYSKEEAIRLLQRRYTRPVRPIRLTLKKLALDLKFRLLARRLREEGWLDWQILGALGSIAINYRTWQMPELVAYRSCLTRPLIGHDNKDDADRGGIDLEARKGLKVFERLSTELSEEEESVDSIPIPLSVFSEERIRDTLHSSTLATVKGLGLENRLDTPVFIAVRHFLTHRYGYLSDDIEHEDVFGRRSADSGDGFGPLTSAARPRGSDRLS